MKTPFISAQVLKSSLPVKENGVMLYIIQTIHARLWLNRSETL